MNEINKASEISIKISRTTTDNKRYKLMYTVKNWKGRNDRDDRDDRRRKDKPKKRKLIIYCNHIMLTSHAAGMA